MGKNPDVDFTLISNYLTILTNKLRAPHYTQLIRKIIEEKFCSHNLFQYHGLVLFSIMKFLYGEQLNQYEEIQGKYYNYLSGDRTKDHNSNVRLVPRKHFFNTTVHHSWVKEFDARAKNYWVQKKRNSEEERRNQNAIMRLYDVGSNAFHRPTRETYVMSEKEFYKLPGAMIVRSQNQRPIVDPHFKASYRNYQAIMFIAHTLDAEGQLQVPIAGIKQCSIQYIYNQTREYYSRKNQYELPQYDLRSSIQSGFYSGSMNDN